MKSPKEEAEELVKQFLEYTDTVHERENAIKCAIICVDRIIKSNPTEPNDGSQYWGKQAKEFWQQVKSELENMK